jgi:hypothetical protein
MGGSRGAAPTQMRNGCSWLEGRRSSFRLPAFLSRLLASVHFAGRLRRYVKETLERRHTITVFPSDTATFTARPGKKLSWIGCGFGGLLLLKHRGASARDAKAPNSIIPGARLYQEVRSENDHVVASANGGGCVGTKNANMQDVSQRGGYGSTIVPKAPQSTQAREGQAAQGQALAKSKKSLRHGNTATEGTNRRREYSFSSTATVKDEPAAVRRVLGLMIRFTAPRVGAGIRGMARPHRLQASHSLLFVLAPTTHFNLPAESRVIRQPGTTCGSQVA